MEHLDEQRLRTLIAAGRALVSELDLETVLERLLQVARDLTGARYAALGVLDPAKERLEQFITAGIDAETHRQIGDLPHGRGVLGLLIREPNPLRLPDVSAHPESYGFPPGHPVMRTFLGVPVRIRGEIYGNLYLTEKDSGAEFDAHDEEAIVVLADWAAIAIENARLYQGAEQRRQQLERAVRGLEVTTTIARAVGGETDLDRVLELIVKRGRALIEARSLAILLEEGGELVIRSTAGELGAPAVDGRVPIEGTVPGEVFRTGVVERVPDVSARQMTEYLKLVGGDATSAIVAPLVFRSRPLGVLIALDRLADGPKFGREDESLLLAFAASAATAVHTATSVAHERLAHALEGVEQERRRWARELHDETLQALGGLQMLLSSAQRTDDPAARDRALRDAAGHIAQEVRNLRSLITELRPAELDELGLASALEALAERRAAADGLKVQLDVDSARLDSNVESTVYRVVQEALTNAAKHAGATHVMVRVAHANGAVEVEVRDDGGGFDPAHPPAGFGLVGMRERVELVRGKFTVESQPGAGTTIRASIRPSGFAP